LNEVFFDECGSRVIARRRGKPRLGCRKFLLGHERTGSRRLGKSKNGQIRREAAREMRAKAGR